MPKLSEMQVSRGEDYIEYARLRALKFLREGSDFQPTVYSSSSRSLEGDRTGVAHKPTHH